MVDSLLAVGGISWTVGDEDAVKVVGDFVDGIIVRERGHACATADHATEDVLLDTAVNQCNV